jgi:hypothetical protein
MDGLCLRNCVDAFLDRAIRHGRISIVLRPLFALALIILSARADAQGTFQGIVLATGSGQSLLTSSQMLPAAIGGSPELTFDFGFSTDETSVPDTFLDSFTVSLAGGDSFAPVLATIDSSGVVWAPVTPGATQLSEAQIIRALFAPPTAPPISGKGSGFSVRFPLPNELIGKAVTVTFDLFDNLDNRMSLGWYKDLQIISVPEPRLVFLLSFGLVSVAMFRRLRV